MVLQCLVGPAIILQYLVGLAIIIAIHGRSSNIIAILGGSSNNYCNTGILQLIAIAIILSHPLNTSIDTEPP